MTKDLLEPVLLVGAMKSGTTTMVELLAGSGLVVPPVMKEPEVLLRSRSARHAERMYGRLWRRRDVQTVPALDASTQYTAGMNAAESAGRLKELIDRSFMYPWIVYLHRDPIHRAISHFRHDVAAHRRPSVAELQSLSGRYCLTSWYRAQLLPFMAVLPPERIIVVSFDGLVSAQSEVLHHLSVRIGIERHARRHTAAHVVANASDQRLAMGRVGRALSSNPVVGWLGRRMTTPKARARLHGVMARPAALPNAETLHAAIPVDVSEFLTSEYERFSADLRAAGPCPAGRGDDVVAGDCGSPRHGVHSGRRAGGGP